jgi:DNA-binding CsgD family transcriptional regulator
VISWAKPFPEKAPFALSGKQAQCFKLLGQGLTPKEVGAQLGISTSSVNTHLKRVKEAIDKARMATEAKNQKGVQFDLAHLAVRCLEAGWNPMIRLKTQIS